MEGIKVLLVDDEVEFTASMRRVLARRGFEVDVADDGLAALPMMTQKRFDVVVLDIKNARHGRDQCARRNQASVPGHPGDHAHRALLFRW